MKKMIKKTMLVTAMAAVSVGAMAQENGNRSAEGKIVRGPYETNRFFDNMFIGIGGGVNLYHGENDSYGKFGDRLAPAIDVSLGKWLTPSVGLRVQYSGFEAKGWTDLAGGYYKGTADVKGMFSEKFNVHHLHGDVMWNISNAIGGYKETRTWSFVPFAGAGWARSSGNDLHNNQFAFTVGLQNVIRLGKVVDLTLEARHMFVNESFDMVARGSKSEGMTSVTAGLSFNLGAKRFKRVSTPAPAPAADYSSYQNRIKALEDSNKSLNDEVTDLRNRKPATVTVENKLVAASPVALFFDLNKAVLGEKELANLDFYVQNAIKLDNAKTFTLIGGADKATGTEQVNQRLSEQRMQYVYDLLVNKYNIPASRLVKKAEGDKNNRFGLPELNRVVIIE